MHLSSNNLRVIIAFLAAAVTTAAVCFLLFKNQGSENIAKLEPIKILIVGDLMFDRGIRYYAKENNGNEYIFDKISKLLASENLVVANLEGPITKNKSISQGTKPGSTDNYFFTFDPSIATTLFNQNIKLVDLGNNHILNFSNQGLQETEKYLSDSKVDYFGAPGASKTFIENIEGLKVAFVSYNQFIGDSEVEAQETIEDIKNAREKADFIIVFSHWDIEYSTYPSAKTQSLAREFIDAGADLVAGSHPHVFQIIDVYKGKRIYYSLGNFIFDQYFDEKVRNSLGVELKIDKKTKQISFAEKYFYLDSNGQTIERPQ